MTSAASALPPPAEDPQTAPAPDRVIAQLCKVDNILGYRYGFFVWLGFWTLSVVGLAEDSRAGPPRDFLAQGALLSSLSLAYFCHHFGVLRNPASTPATHAITCEAFARFVLLVYHGADEVLCGGTLGAINTVVVVGMSLFGLLNTAKLVYVLFHPDAYFRYEERQRGSPLA